MTSEAELEELAKKDVDELYILLAQSDPLSADELFSASEARDYGRRKFDGLTDSLRQRVCVEWNFCEKHATDSFADTITLTAALADIVISIVGGPPAGTIATLLVKKGLTRFYQCSGG